MELNTNDMNDVIRIYQISLRFIDFVGIIALDSSCALL